MTARADPADLRAWALFLEEARAYAAALSGWAARPVSEFNRDPPSFRRLRRSRPARETVYPPSQQNLGSPLYALTRIVDGWIRQPPAPELRAEQAPEMARLAREAVAAMAPREPGSPRTPGGD